MVGDQGGQAAMHLQETLNMSSLSKDFLLNILKIFSIKYFECATSEL